MKFLAITVLTIAVTSANVFYNCSDFPIKYESAFRISCDAEKVVIVESAIIGATDKYTPPNGCPITNNTCINNVTFPAEYCTGYSSCSFAQRNLLYNESKFQCGSSNAQSANLINVNYSCINPVQSVYGDICDFQGDVYSTSSVYITSYPEFPNNMPPSTAFQCSCSFTSSSSRSGSIIIRALLVKLPRIDPCVEQLIVHSAGEDILTFCSPSTSTNNVTTIPVANNFSILFQRNSSITVPTGKFMFQLTVSDFENLPSAIGRMNCGMFDHSSTTPSSSNTNPAVSFPTSSMKNSLAPSPTPGDSKDVTYVNTKSIVPSRSSLYSDETSGKTNAISLQVSDSHNSRLSSGAVAGIVIGVFFCVLIGPAIILLIVIRKRLAIKRKKNDHQSNVLPSVDDINQIPPSPREDPNYAEIGSNTETIHFTEASNNPNASTSQPVYEIQKTNDYLAPKEGSESQHVYYNSQNEGISLTTKDKDYEPLRSIDKSQHAYYNHMGSEEAYQPLGIFK